MARPLLSKYILHKPLRPVMIRAKYQSCCSDHIPSIPDNLGIFELWSNPIFGKVRVSLSLVKTAISLGWDNSLFANLRPLPGHKKTSPCRRLRIFFTMPSSHDDALSHARIQWIKKNQIKIRSFLQEPRATLACIAKIRPLIHSTAVATRKLPLLAEVFPHFSSSRNNFHQIALIRIIYHIFI
jgi:hypothetical protein